MISYEMMQRIKERQRRTPEVLEKWRKTGLLGDLRGQKEIMMAWLLENQEEHNVFAQKQEVEPTYRGVAVSSLESLE
jgi:hypothetical protein